MKLYYFQERENSLENRTNHLFHRHGSLAIGSKKGMFQGSLSPFVYPGQTEQISRPAKEKKLKENESVDRGKRRRPASNHHPPFVPGPFSASYYPKSTGPPVMSCPLPLFSFFFFFFSSFYPSTPSNDSSSRGKRRSLPSSSSPSF